MDIPRNERGIAIPGREGEFLDPRTLSQTPGGSIYGTTPGGNFFQFFLMICKKIKKYLLFFSIFFIKELKYFMHGTNYYS